MMNWNLNAASASQQPASTSDFRFNALNEKVHKSNCKIESWPSNKQARTGKKAMDPMANFQAGIG